jgi:hypothetical protein
MVSMQFGGNNMLSQNAVLQASGSGMTNSQGGLLTLSMDPTSNDTSAGRMKNSRTSEYDLSVTKQSTL